MGILVFLAKWGFTQLSNDLKERIIGLHGSIEKLKDTQQQFSLEYVRKVEFERELLKLETQTENTVSRMEIKLEKIADKIEQLLMKESGN